MRRRKATGTQPEICGPLLASPSGVCLNQSPSILLSTLLASASEELDHRVHEMAEDEDILKQPRMPRTRNSGCFKFWLKKEETRQNQFKVHLHHNKPHCLSNHSVKKISHSQPRSKTLSLLHCLHPKSTSPLPPDANCDGGAASVTASALSKQAALLPRPLATFCIPRRYYAAFQLYF